MKIDLDIEGDEQQGVDVERQAEPAVRVAVRVDARIRRAGPCARHRGCGGRPARRRRSSGTRTRRPRRRTPRRTRCRQPNSLRAARPERAPLPEDPVESADAPGRASLTPCNSSSGTADRRQSEAPRSSSAAGPRGWPRCPRPSGGAGRARRHSSARKACRGAARAERACRIARRSPSGRARPSESCGPAVRAAIGESP